MEDRPTPDAICHEISSELVDMARWLAGSELSADQYRLALSRMEDRKLKRYGLKLRSSVSEKKLVHFTLRFADSDEFCASMDVDPGSGAMTIERF